MSRYRRPVYTTGEVDRQTNDEARNRLLFDWWCDEGELEDEGDAVRESDRLRYIRDLQGRPEIIRSRAPRQEQDDPSPPLDVPAPQGFQDVWLLSDPAHIHEVLTNTKDFSNLPYAALGGASFLLGLDPGPGYRNVNWHAEQKALFQAALDDYPESGLRELACRAVEQAALTSLAQPEFDLATFAEQAALRYMGLLFGYGFQDHGLLEEASKATYRALQYLTIGQHFVTEPGTLLAAKLALGRLIGRTSQLMEDYTRLQRAPRRYGREPGRDWPDGVQPWCDLGLCTALGEPLLKRLPKLVSTLSGRDRATVAATLLAGTLGNIQTAVCLVTRSLLKGRDDELTQWRKAAVCQPNDGCADRDDAWLEAEVARRMARKPPVPVLPRRTRKRNNEDRAGGGVELSGGTTIPFDTDCLLLLEGQHDCPHAAPALACPHIWGDVFPPGSGAHACLGQDLSLPLITALVRHVLCLPGIKPALDRLTGESLKLERLWGFACTRYRLHHDREQVRVQQNLIVSMRVKSPIGENAAQLRRLIANAVPRVEDALAGFGKVHFAWFEFSDDDTQLVLRTIYDGAFEPYLEHFARRAGDLFDGLFEFLEGAPPRPVAEHPQEFAETLRRYNRAPLAGYLYSAYPRSGAEQIRKTFGYRP